MKIFKSLVFTVIVLTVLFITACEKQDDLLTSTPDSKAMTDAQSDGKLAAEDQQSSFTIEVPASKASKGGDGLAPPIAYQFSLMNSSLPTFCYSLQITGPGTNFSSAGCFASNQHLTVYLTEGECYQVNLTVNPWNPGLNGTIDWRLRRIAGYLDCAQSTICVPGNYTGYVAACPSPNICPGVPPSFLSVTPANHNVGNGPGSVNFSVSSNLNWTASTAASWITLNPTSGSNNGVVTATFTANPSYSSARVGTITVTSPSGCFSKTVTITQEPVCTNGSEPQNDQISTAPNIAPNGEGDKASQIGTSTDVDFWQFTLAQTTNINLFLGNLPANYNLYLIGSNGQTLASSTNLGTAAENINATLAAGNYFAKIVGYKGAYSTTQCYLLEVYQ